MPPRTKLGLRYKVAFICLALVIVIGVAKYTVPDQFPATDYPQFHTESYAQLVDSIGSLVFSIVASVFTAIFVVHRLNKISQEDFERTIEEKVDDIKTVTMEKIYGKLVEPELWEVIQQDLFDSAIIRKNWILRISFTADSGGNLADYYRMTWQEDIFNRTSGDYTHRLSTMTADKEERVVLEQLELVAPDRDEHRSIPVSQDTSQTVSRQNFEVLIGKRSFVKLIYTFKLKCKLTNNWVHNCVGVSTPLIDLQVIVEKPAGYTFGINLLGGKILGTKAPDSQTELTQLNYYYKGAIFPGSGLEYYLEAPVDSDD